MTNLKRLSLLLLLATAAASTLAAQDEPFSHMILIEPTSWTVLEQKNAASAAPIASMTKMMTALVVHEMVEEGKLDWNKPIETSAKASSMGGSQVYLRHREVFPLSEMMTAMTVHSANDAAMAIAEGVAGSEGRFVELMNAKARELGLNETRFLTPHGLPGEAGTPDDVSSPRDLARLGWELMKHPEARRLSLIKTLPFRNGEFILYNPNDLLDRYEYATGIKTGTHDRAGSCVTASAKKGGMELIAVFMGAQQRRELFQVAENTFEEAFDTWEIVEPVKRGMQAPAPAPVSGGRVPNVAAVAAADARVVVRRDQKSQIATEVQMSNPPAPVEQGERVGWILVSRDGKAIGRVPLVATAAVAERSIAQKFWDHVWPW